MTERDPSVRSDLFVHHSEVLGDPASLAPNDEVEYGLGEGKRGPIALAVKPRKGRRVRSR